MSCFGLIADTWLIHLDWLQANAGCQLATFGVGIGVGSYRCANLALLGRKFSTCSIVVFCTTEHHFLLQYQLALQYYIMMVAMCAMVPTILHHPACPCVLLKSRS